MERYELNRMFEQLSPTPEQEQAMLDSLLAEGKEKPVKHVRRFVVLIAAALILITCVTAAQLNVIDPRMLEYYDVAPEKESLLAPAAVMGEASHTYENGWTVEIKQVVSDLWYTAALCEITAPEGVVLEEDGEHAAVFHIKAVRLNENGHGMGLGFGIDEEILDDGDPNDNHMTVLYSIRYNGTAGEPYMKVGVVGPNESMQLRPERVSLLNQGGELADFTQEDWSYTVDIPAAGRQYELKQPFQQNGLKARTTNLYLSPFTLNFHLIYDGDPDDFDPTTYDLMKERDRDKIRFFVDEVDEIFLHTRDGREIPVRLTGGIGHNWGFVTGIFEPAEVIDPAQITAVTIGEQTYDLRDVPYHME